MIVLDAIIEAPTHGWGSGLVLGELAAGAVLLAVFVGYELRRAEPMLDPRIFKIGAVSLACVLVMLLYIGMFGLFYVNAQYLEQAKGYDLLLTGLAIGPMALGIFVAARYSIRVGARLGHRAGDLPRDGADGRRPVRRSRRSQPRRRICSTSPTCSCSPAGFGITLPLVSAAIVTATPASAGRPGLRVAGRHA